jgi:hypothetical protein
MRRAALLLLLGGCATSIQPPAEGVWIIGRTRPDEIRDVYGKPSADRPYDWSGFLLRRLLYIEDGTRRGPNGEVRDPSRTLHFDFYEGRLAGYAYTSTYPGESGPLPSDAAARIRAGVTRSEELADWFGPPSGRAGPPLAPDGQERLLWLIRGEVGLSVLVDRKGTVVSAER